MNDLITAETHDLANIDQELAEEAKKVASALAGANTIKTTSGRFIFPGKKFEEGVAGPLHMVILSARMHKQLWNKEYDSKDTIGQRGLICAAVGDITLERNNLIPFDTAPEMQNPTCKDCPQNHWEKGPAGKNVKVGKCKDGMSFAVMFPDPERQGGEIFIIRGSATGLSEYIKTIKDLKARFGHPVRGIVSLSFVPAGGSLRVSTQIVGPNPNYTVHAIKRHEGDAAIAREPRWFEEESDVGSAPAPATAVRHEAPASAGRGRSRARANEGAATPAAGSAYPDDDAAF